MKHLRWTSLFGAIYLIGSGDFSPQNLGIAAIVGLLLARVERAAHSEHRRWRLVRTSRLPYFVFGVARELLKGSLSMLRVLVGSQSWRRIGWVEHPISSLDACETELLGWVTSATPGSILVEASKARGTLLLNVIDAEDPARVRADLERFYTRFQRALTRG